MLDKITSKVLSEYFSLFLIRRKLETLGITKGRITICQHRRFVTNVPIGEKATNLSSTQMIRSSIAPGLDQALLTPISGDYLIGSIQTFRTPILNQYHNTHHLRDILRFFSDLIDAKLIEDTDAHNLLNMNILIPAPSCGVFPIKSFLEIFSFLEKCALVWHNGGYIPRTDYQARSTGFLLERLNSYLLVRILSSSGISVEQAIGYTTVVAENNILTPGS